MAKSTLNIIYSITDKIKPKLSDDTLLPDEEWILDKMNDVRANIIREVFTQTRKLDDMLYQQRDCIELECREIVCVTDLPYRSERGESISDRDIKSGDIQYFIHLPELQGGIGWHNIKYLGLSDYKTGFERKSLIGFNNHEGALYTGREPAYTITDGIQSENGGPEALVRNAPTAGVKFLGIIAIFSGPTTLCDTRLEDDYPLTDDLINRLELLVVRDILSTLGLPLDAYNDASAVEDQLSQQDKKNIEQVQKNVGG